MYIYIYIDTTYGIDSCRQIVTIATDKKLRYVHTILSQTPPNLSLFNKWLSASNSWCKWPKKWPLIPLLNLLFRIDEKHSSRKFGGAVTRQLANNMNVWLFEIGKLVNYCELFKMDILGPNNQIHPYALSQTKTGSLYVPVFLFPGNAATLAC